MKVIQHILIAVVGFLLSLPCAAQELATIDKIKLKNGSVWQGKIVEWGDDSLVTVETLNGAIIRIPDTEIVRVRQVITGDNWVKRPYTFRETGFYHAISVGLSGNTGPGISGTYAFGYRFNRLVNVGVGTGFESFDVGTGKNIIPVFAEFRGFVTRTKVSPYYALRLGYGFALRNAAFDIRSARGGWMANPEIGLRFGGGTRVSPYVGMGLHFQQATFNYEMPWSEFSSSERYLYKRWELKVGITF